MNGSTGRRLTIRPTTPQSPVSRPRRTVTRTADVWWILPDLNRPPPHCKCGALPDELKTRGEVERPGILEIPSAGWKPTALPLKLQSQTLDSR